MVSDYLQRPRRPLEHMRQEARLRLAEIREMADRLRAEDIRAEVVAEFDAEAAWWGRRLAELES